MIRSILLPLLLGVLPLSAAAQTVSSLRTEHLESPLGIDNPAPRFSWRVEDGRSGARQTAYRIVLATDSLDFGGNRVWDSGRVASDAMLAVYGGPALRPFTRYWWKVTCEVETPGQVGHEASPVPSQTAYFETGMTDERNWRGCWISDKQNKDFKPAPRFRKEFKIRGGIAGARAYIAVAGLYSLYVNGRKVGDSVLDPAFTRFDRRVLYSTYDITPLLQEGDNAVGVELGNGWYNHQAVTTWHFDRAPWRARPAFCMDIRIRYQDGSGQVVIHGTGLEDFVRRPAGVQ